MRNVACDYRGGERPDLAAHVLLRVADVERQPFRSMGFVAVIIVSVLFALGLPLVVV